MTEARMKEATDGFHSTIDGSNGAASGQIDRGTHVMHTATMKFMPYATANKATLTRILRVKKIDPEAEDQGPPSSLATPPEQGPPKSLATPAASTDEDD